MDRADALAAVLVATLLAGVFMGVVVSLAAELAFASFSLRALTFLLAPWPLWPSSQALTLLANLREHRVS